MFIRQFFVKGIAHSSYLLGGTKTCAIVDPRRDVGIYIAAAAGMEMKITHILETHMHADFISGHLDLAGRTGAKIYAPKSARCRYPHVPLKEGDVFEIEDIELRVIETPGHTPEHIAYVVTDRSRGGEPAAIFCGDTLFVGDVGRPDLFPEIAEELASKLFDSLHKKILQLPEFCEVYPAHGAGSLCGRSMGAKRTSTIGYERLYNSALLIESREEFIRSLTTNMPPAPDHFSRCSAVNIKGPALVADLPPILPLSPRQFREKVESRNCVVLDTRPYESFGGQHVPGSYNIDIGGNFATFSGWMLPPDRDILLVVDSPKLAREAAVWLRRVGLDMIRGFLDGGMFEWAREGLPMGHICQLSAKELHGMLKKGKVTLIDVRAPAEFNARHIKGALNIPLPDLRTRYREIKTKKPIALICSTGHRSSIGASILARHRFEKIYNVAGGMTGYSAAGYSAECPLCMAPHGPRIAAAEKR